MRVTGDDHLYRAERIVGAVPNVEPQIGLPAFGIGTVAMEALVGKNRPDVAREVDSARIICGRSRSSDRNRNSQNDPIVKAIADQIETIMAHGEKAIAVAMVGESTRREVEKMSRVRR